MNTTTSGTRVKVEQHNLIHRLRLDGPPHNLMVESTFDALAHAFSLLGEADSLQGPRCVVIDSLIPGTFSLGLDPHVLLSLEPEARLPTFMALARMIRAACLCPLPILTGVGGPAFAGGAVLALLGDVVIMERFTGVVCFSEAKVGLPLPSFVLELIKRRVIPSQCFDVAVLGKKMDGVSAKDAGLVDQLYDDEAQRVAWESHYVGRFNRLAPKVVESTCKELRRPILRAVEEFLRDPHSFAYFLGEEYLGRGLSQYIKGEAVDFSKPLKA